MGQYAFDEGGYVGLSMINDAGLVSELGIQFHEPGQWAVNAMQDDSALIF